MRIPIEPGTLCWIVNTFQENTGKVAEVVRRAEPRSVFTDSKVWWCVSKSAMRTAGTLTRSERITPAGKEFVAGECHLVPIAGPRLKDAVVEYDKRLACSTGLHPHSFGSGMPGAARSTPFARR
jgi:hypothetical protein